jgi:hypothetical protein
VISPSSFRGAAQRRAMTCNRTSENPQPRSGVWIPDSRGACHRVALCADPLAASGMTIQGSSVEVRNSSACASVGKRPTSR